MKVSAISAFNDNYIWAIHDHHHLILVDPGDAKPVEAFMAEQQLELKAILITHHHQDHVGGVSTLIEAHPEVELYGPANERLPLSPKPLEGGEQLHFSEPPCSFEVLAIPGHTLGHIAYSGLLGLFCGDTLFHSGCGRIFEGTAEQMLHSLTQLAALPEDTLVYCAHEYTESNLNFAQAVEADNPDLLDTIKKVKEQRALHQPTLPTTLAEQKRVNPFLRLKSNSLKNSVELWCQHACQSELELFTQLRRWKDQF